jgi:integrase/recombinase XerD
MSYQYKREPLTAEEANRLAAVCNTYEEKLIVWTLLDTGLRVAALANLTKENLDWQSHRLMIYGREGRTARNQNVASFRLRPECNH